jgi:hypothetical protein
MKCEKKERTGGIKRKNFSLFLFPPIQLARIYQVVCLSAIMTRPYNTRMRTVDDTKRYQACRT